MLCLNVCLFVQLSSQEGRGCVEYIGRKKEEKSIMFYNGRIAESVKENEIKTYRRCDGRESRKCS